METPRPRSRRQASLATLDTAPKAVFVEAARATPAQLLQVLDRLEPAFASNTAAAVT